MSPPGHVSYVVPTDVTYDPLVEGRSTLGRGRSGFMLVSEETAMDDRRSAERSSQTLAWLLGRVRDAMTTSLVSLEPGMRAIDATAILARHQVAGAPVLERGHVVGIVTCNDLGGRATHQQRTGPFLRPVHGHEEPRVGDLMHRSVVVAAPEEPLLVAVKRMADEGVDRLPVVDEARRPVGILARDDVIRALADAAARLAGEATPRRPVLLPD